ncbi:MAG: hypothetical protein R3F61_11265 [Myxococcota bacterium]
MKAWPHVRAALLAAHLLAIVLMALPSPQGGMNRSAWKDPTVQGELAAWTLRLNAVGIGMQQPEVEELAWNLANAYEDGRGVVLAPFMPYYRYCGTWQSWRMFVAPHRFPGRLTIDVMERGEWRTIYVARSADHTWRATQLDHDRMRAAIFRYGWRHYRRSYGTFGSWVAARVIEDFPDAERVRLRFYKYRTASPEEVRTHTEPEGEYTGALILDLKELR